MNESCDLLSKHDERKGEESNKAFNLLYNARITYITFGIGLVQRI